MLVSEVKKQCSMKIHLAPLPVMEMKVETKMRYRHLVPSKMAKIEIVLSHYRLGE